MEDSKCYLSVRGDTPHTHALMRAVAVGCIPVVVSNHYPLCAPALPHTLDMQDYAVILDEDSFLSDPLGTLLSLDKMFNTQTKLEGLRFAQQVALPNHPKGFFYHQRGAFIHEANLAMQRYNLHTRPANLLKGAMNEPIVMMQQTTSPSHPLYSKCWISHWKPSKQTEVGADSKTRGPPLCGRTQDLFQKDVDKNGRPR